MTRELQLPRTSECGALARRWLERELGASIDATALADAKLVLTELVDNAFLHGEGGIRVRLDTGRDRLRLEVTDHGSGAAIQIREHADQIGGWGLRVVDRLSMRWGAFEGTTHVWAELPAPGAGPAEVAG